MKLFFKRILIFLITCSINFCFGQSQNLNEYQLLKIQSFPINEAKVFLTTNSWDIKNSMEDQSDFYYGLNLEYNAIKFINNANDQITLYFYPNKQNLIIYQLPAISFNTFLNQMKSSKGGATSSKGNYNVTLFKNNNISIEFRAYKNENSIKKYSILIYNPISLNKDIFKAKEKEIARMKFAKDREDKYQRAIVSGNSLFKIEKYQEAIQEYETVINLFPNRLEIFEKIALSKKELSNQIANKAIDQENNAKYNAAILLYQEALKVGVNNKYINDKIVHLKRKINEDKIKNLMTEALQLFNEDKFNESLIIYSKINQLDPENIAVNDKIKEINSVINILSDRENKVFKYSEINPTAFNNFKSDLDKEFNEKIESSKEGKINFKYYIEFDKNGNNKSYLMNKYTTIQSLDKYLSTFDYKSVLTPSLVGKYNVASNELIDIDLNWYTNIVSYKFNYKGVKTQDNSILNQNVFTNFIYGQSSGYGRYTFEVTNKKNNFTESTGIHLIKYNVAGPESALLSMICPGLGALNVTQGEKGWGRLGVFIAAAGVSVVTKINSDKQYQKYLDSQNSSESEQYYNKSNNLHKISLFSGGVAATIYLYDIIWVFSKGNQNLKKSKNLREQVKEKPIEITKPDIT